MGLFHIDLNTITTMATMTSPETQRMPPLLVDTSKFMRVERFGYFGHDRRNKQFERDKRARTTR